MILLFGDSWARQSWQHIETEDCQGYRHWRWPNICCQNNIDDWFNDYFTAPIINFAEGGNTTDGILQDLYQRIGRLSNLNNVNIVVYQTDPLRIFAPWQDYTQRDIVWPKFQEWCALKNFDLYNSTVSDLVHAIYDDWYGRLAHFHQWNRSRGASHNVRMWLVGGVVGVHPVVSRHQVQVLIPSVAEFFGLDKDCCFENRLSLNSLVKFWRDHHHDPDRLKQDYLAIDTMLIEKEHFWVSNTDIFAGRHLTAKAFGALATHIQQRLGYTT